MGQKYPDYVEEFWRWMKPLIDLYDHGERFKGGVPRINTTEQLARFKQGCRYFGGRFIQQLRKKDFARHLLDAQRMTLYYGPCRSSDYWLICLDIDAHEGQDDALEVVRYLIGNFFSGAYYEPSTNGQGYHLYVLLRGIQYKKRRTLNKLITALSKALRKIVAAEGFESQVCDIFGTFTVEEGGELKRGSCAKIPRLPHNMESLRCLVTAPQVPWSQLEWMVFQFEMFGQIDGLPYSGLDTVLENIGEVIADNTAAPAAPGYPVGNRARLKMRSSNAWTRTLYSVMAVAQDLHRLPEYDEWHAFYTAHSLNTGDDPDHRRPPRFADAIKLVGKTFSPSLSGSGSYQVGEYLELLKRLIPPSELEAAAVDAKYRTPERKKRLTYEDLDIGLGFHTRETLTFRTGHKPFSVAQDRMIGFFRELKKEGRSSRSCDFGKLYAVRLALSRAGMIVCLDPSYRVGNPKQGIEGQAQLWGLGENHPRYGDFALMRETINRKRASGYVGWADSFPTSVNSPVAQDRL